MEQNTLDNKIEKAGPKLRVDHVFEIPRGPT